MSKFDLYEEYYYDDPDNEYTYPDSSVLRNKCNIREFEELVKQEYRLVRTKALDLYVSPILVHSMKDVCKIHFKLFSELYEWAGNYRKVNISKQGKAFMAMQSFATGEQYMDSLFNDYYDNAHDVEQISAKLAVILDNLNYMHPYREGNGRTQREVIRVLALAKGYELLINVDGEDGVYKQYMDGTVYSDVKILDQLIRSLLEKMEE
ncbi:cell filamentation protein Fic [Listeria monocytogenes]|nr:cell filamentation protein Fic [Listeria monocytogenes]